MIQPHVVLIPVVDRRRSADCVEAREGDRVGRYDDIRSGDKLIGDLDDGVDPGGRNHVAGEWLARAWIDDIDALASCGIGLAQR